MLFFLVLQKTRTGSKGKVYNQRLTDIPNATDAHRGGCRGAWKKGDSWVSRKSANGKLQLDGPNMSDHHDTPECETRFWKEIWV